MATRPIKTQFDDKLLRQLQHIVSAVSGNEFLISTMEQILPILCFFFYRESAYDLMNGQLVLFQWADCAVKKLGLEYFFRCAGIVTETALYILSKRCNFGKLEPVKDTVVLKKNKENHRYKHFLSSASAYYYPMILIPGIVYGYYAIFEMTSYSLISFSNNHPIISFVGVSKSTYPLNWKLSSWNRHFIVVSENNRFSQI